ncbi:hypothetical protein [Chitinophaga sp. S165]|uniref:hypothetical protein n=1 Tax=Chitinophaga sp. S165 TaxID=2135462 RepID=UPI000D70D8EB|nr:hypothetical protein [Chitinophaga sp. S165]PWV53277.1 hypothetical protein C7475_10223 [Chitinophaga sp. S165]
MNVIELLRKTSLSVVWMIIFTGIKAQTVPPSLDTKVRVPEKKMNIIMLGDIITAQTGLILSFNAQKIIAQKQLWLPHTSYSIHQLLAMIKEATGAEYTIYREHIIFHQSANLNNVNQATARGQTKQQITLPGANQEQHTYAVAKQSKPPLNKPAGSAAQHHNPAKPAQHVTKKSILSGNDTGNEKAVQTARSSNDSNSIHRDTVTANYPDAGKGITNNISSGSTDNTFADIANDSLSAGKQQPYTLNYLTSTAIMMTPVKPSSPTLLIIRPTIPQQRQRRIYKKPGLFKPFIATGFAADEVLYANFQVRAGITLLYGIAGWSTNFSASGFRYGAGSSYPLKNGWLIQLEATTGKLSKAANVRPVFDTSVTQFTINTHSRLQRISLFAQKNIAARWSVYAGPVFNHLKSVYYRNDWQINPAFINNFLIARDRDYMILRPPYTTSSTPPEKPENVKTWIGLQAGINYRF